MTGKDKDAQARIDKETVKEALKEWLDDKFAAFGRWSFAAAAAAAFAALMYFVLKMNGWQRVTGP